MFKNSFEAFFFFYTYKRVRLHAKITYYALLARQIGALKKSNFLYSCQDASISMAVVETFEGFILIMTFFRPLISFV